MLLMSAILFTGICVLIVFFAALGSRSTKQKTAVRGAVAAEIKSIVERAEQLDVDLANSMAEGKETAESISRWQQDRQALVTTARTKHPWAWTEDDLGACRVQKVRDLSQRITQQAMLHMAIGVAAIVFLFGGATLLTYAHYAHQGQVIGELDAADAPAWEVPPAGDWSGTSSPWLDAPSHSPSVPMDAGPDADLSVPENAPLGTKPPDAPESSLPPESATADAGADLPTEHSPANPID